MKHLVLILALLVGSVALSADTILYQQNFETGWYPGGWDTISFTDSYWTVDSPGCNSDYKLHIYNSAPSSIDYSLATTSSINLSGLNGNPLSIDFDLFQGCNLQTPDIAMFQLQYSYDEMSWYPITEYGCETFNEWAHVQYSFDPEGHSEIYFGFLGYLSNTNGTYIELAVDNFELSMPSPELNVSANPISLGSCLVGDEISQAFTVFNSGTQALEYTISVTEPFYIRADGVLYSTYNSILSENGATNYFDMVFQPVEDCTYTSATLNFTSNDPDNLTKNVIISASARMPVTGSKSIQFNDDNDYAKTFRPVDLPAGSAISMEMWFNVYSGGPQIQFLTSSGMETLEIHLNTNYNNLRFIPAPGVYLDTPNNSVTFDTWTHLAFVYDPTNTYAKVYINGVDTPYTLSGGNPISTPVPTPLSTTRFGIRCDGMYQFNGAMDEIRFWTNVLTADEIRRNRHFTLSLPRPGMLAYWRCNETEGGGLIEDINKRHAKVQNFEAGDRIDTGFPIGDGFSVSYVAPAGSGTLDCFDCSVRFDFSACDQQDIVVTYLYGAPMNPPTGCYTVFNDNTRIIQTFGSTNMAGDITFSSFGDMTTADEVLHDNIHLNGRDARGVANFDNLSGASSVDPAADSATFPLASALPNAQQFIITRQVEPVYPVMSVNTNTLDFGTTLIGTASEGWLHIDNNGTADLSWTVTVEGPVTVTGYNGEDNNTLSATQAAGTGFDLQFKYYPTTEEYQSGSFQIVSNDPVQSTQTIEWSGTGLYMENGEYALSFSGANQHVEFPIESGMVTSAYTIEMWFMRPEYSPSAQFLCAKHTENYEIHLAGNAIRFIPAYHVYLDTPANVFEDGVWNHLACSYNPEAGFASMYLNGKEIPLVNNGPYPMTTYTSHSDTPFYLASRSYNQLPFTGYIDEVRLWNGVRTADEIRMGMHNQPDPTTANLKHYWRMNHGSGGTVYDLTYRMNGTVVGATWMESPLILGDQITYSYQTPGVAGILDCPEVGVTFDFPSAVNGRFYITTNEVFSAVRTEFDAEFAHPNRILHYYGDALDNVTMTVRIQGSFDNLDEYDPSNIRLLKRADGDFSSYELSLGAVSVDPVNGTAAYENPINAINGMQFILVRENALQLSKPTNLTLNVGEGNVYVSWNAVNGATSYCVYQSETLDGTFMLCTNGETTETSWSAPLPLSRMFYRVTAKKD